MEQLELKDVKRLINLLKKNGNGKDADTLLMAKLINMKNKLTVK